MQCRGDKMKRRIAAVVIVLVIGAAFSIWYIADSTEPSESERITSTVDHYEEMLGIQLLEPGRIETLWSSRGWFGDGESITMFDYTNSNPLILEQGLNLVTEVNLDFANELISKFIDDTLSMRGSTTDVSNVFKQHNVKVSIDDYYYYEKNNQGYDYIIVAFKKPEQKLYILEWYQ